MCAAAHHVHGVVLREHVCEGAVFSARPDREHYSNCNTAEAYDPTTNTWTAIASMGTARDELAAVIL
eukprot:COSAG01_NODE_4271_length_5194_cov_4.338567_1_plen_67_part_00